MLTNEEIIYGVESMSYKLQKGFKKRLDEKRLENIESGYELLLRSEQKRVQIILRVVDDGHTVTIGGLERLVLYLQNCLKSEDIETALKFSDDLLSVLSKIKHGKRPFALGMFEEL